MTVQIREGHNKTGDCYDKDEHESTITISNVLKYRTGVLVLYSVLEDVYM